MRSIKTYAILFIALSAMTGCQSCFDQFNKLEAWKTHTFCGAGLCGPHSCGTGCHSAPAPVYAPIAVAAPCPQQIYAAPMAAPCATCPQAAPCAPACAPACCPQNTCQPICSPIDCCVTDVCCPNNCCVTSCGCGDACGGCGNCGGCNNCNTGNAPILNQGTIIRDGAPTNTNSGTFTQPPAGNVNPGPARGIYGP